jgi:hypothetical protein
MSETSVDFHDTTRRYNQQYSELHTCRRENLKSHSLRFVLILSSRLCLNLPYEPFARQSVTETPLAFFVSPSWLGWQCRALRTWLPQPPGAPIAPANADTQSGCNGRLRCDFLNGPRGAPNSTTVLAPFHDHPGWGGARAGFLARVYFLPKPSSRYLEAVFNSHCDDSFTLLAGTQQFTAYSHTYGGFIKSSLHTNRRTTFNCTQCFRFIIIYFMTLFNCTDCGNTIVN